MGGMWGHCKNQIIDEGGDESRGMFVSKRLKDEGNSKHKEKNRERVSLVNSFGKPGYKGIACEATVKGNFGIFESMHEDGLDYLEYAEMPAIGLPEPSKLQEKTNETKI